MSDDMIGHILSLLLMVCLISMSVFSVFGIILAIKFLV